MCVCVRERERKRERFTKTETETENLPRLAHSHTQVMVTSLQSPALVPPHNFLLKVMV